MNDELSANSKVSHYRIVSKIGAGGMGEVYRARDERLDRDVAIKMLPADVASDDDRLQRFKQEARATSNLNHPNILTVYDIGEHDGVPFIVSELLVGEELRDRLNEGSIPLRKSIDYAQQIVSGLAAAHENGVTHRDLKPENLFITKDDRVKILDFGLAKLREAPTGIHASEDATKRALTDPGVVMGTVGYMSPEQVRGQALDHRSDIFSFGVILYEMLSGKRAFGGDSVVEAMHSILKDDVPDLDESGIRVPPSVDKLMRRCLEKKPDHRFHSAHDLGFALDAVASPTSSSGSGLTIAAAALNEEASVKRPAWRGYAAWGIAVLCLITAVAFASLYFGREQPRADAMRFAIPPPDKNLFSEGFALSPDGRSLAFIARGSLGDTTMWVRSLDKVAARQLPGTDGAAFPFWSPDGKTIGFFAGGKLKKVEAAGGPPQSLADTSADPRGGTWAPDGTIIFSPNTLSPLMRVSSSGGTVSEVTKLNADIAQSSHRWPTMLPDGKHFLYFGRGGAIERQGVYAASLDGSEPKFIVPSQVTGLYAESNGVGYLLFVREKVLMIQRFDSVKLELAGDAVPMVEHILAFPGEVGPTAYVAVSAAAGNLVYRTGDSQTTRLTWFDRGGKELESINEPAAYHEPQLSNDGTKVLYSRNDLTGPQDVYLQDLARGNTARLTFDGASDSTAVFSPDGTQIIFFSNRNAKTGLYRKASNGAGDEETVVIDALGIYPDSWSPDGKYLLCDRNGGPRTKVDLWLFPLAGGDPIPYLASEFEEGHGQFSPDGRWIAYTSNLTGKPEVYIESYPRGNGKWQISTTGGDGVHWRKDGKELFYLAPDNNMMSVSIDATSSGIQPSRPAILFPTSAPQGAITDDKNNFAPTADGQKFLVNTLSNSTNAEPITLVLNWASDLRK